MKKNKRTREILVLMLNKLNSYWENQNYYLGMCATLSELVRLGQITYEERTMMLKYMQINAPKHQVERIDNMNTYASIKLKYTGTHWWHLSREGCAKRCQWLRKEIQKFT